MIAVGHKMQLFAAAAAVVVMQGLVTLIVW